VDRLPPIEAIHGSPPISNEKRHSTDFLRPFHTPAPRHEPMMPHNSFHQNQHDHHHAPSDRRESIDQSQRKMSFPSHPVVHERSSSFNDPIGRRASLFDKLGMTTTAAPGAIPVDEAALNRYSSSLRSLITGTMKYITKPSQFFPIMPNDSMATWLRLPSIYAMLCCIPYMLLRPLTHIRRPRHLRTPPFLHQHISSTLGKRVTYSAWKHSLPTIEIL